MRCPICKKPLAEPKPGEKLPPHFPFCSDRCKLVDLNWRCSRQILQQKVNTESVQTAKIVIRNEHPH